jgi:hypothetical protein
MDSMVAYWNLSNVNSPNLCPATYGLYDLTGTGLVASTDIVPGVGGGMGTDYNGSDEYHKSVVSDFRSVDSQGTIFCFLKLNALGTLQTIFGSCDEATANYFFQFRVGVAGKLEITQKNNDTQSTISGDTILEVGRIYFVALVSDGTAWSLFVEDDWEGLSVLGGANDGDWFADTDNRDNISSGAVIVSSITHYLNGMIDELGVLSKPLTKLQLIDLNRKIRTGRLSQSWRLTSPKFLKGHWPLNNHADDVSGQGNDGTFTNEAYVPGPFQKSVGVFDGADSMVNVSPALVGVGDISVSAMIKLDTFGEAGSGRIFDNGKFVFTADDINDNLRVSSNGSTFTDSATNSIVLGSVYHVVITRTAAGLVSFYIDRELSGAADQNSGTPEAGSVNTTIGNRANQVRTLDGKEWSVRLYNIILTLDEVIALNRMDKRI